jgi:hypothetical protein
MSIVQRLEILTAKILGRVAPRHAPPPSATQSRPPGAESGCQAWRARERPVLGAQVALVSERQATISIVLTSTERPP